MTPGLEPGTDLERAGRRAYALAALHPALARSQGMRVFRAAAAAGDLRAASASALALGAAAHQQGDFGTAAAHLESAAWLAWRVRDRPLEAEARAALSRSLLADGRQAAAERQAGMARAAGTVLPITGARGGVAAEERAGHLRSRATADLATGEFEAAEAELAEAQSLSAHSGDLVAQAELAHLWGRLAWRRGDVALALRRFDESAAVFERRGPVPPELILDRFRAMLEAGLASEVRTAAAEAVDEFKRAGVSPATLAQLRLVQTAAALADDEPAEALEAVSMARMECAQAGLPAAGAVARLQFFQAAAQAGVIPVDFQPILATADHLDRAGLLEHGSEARMIAARLALDSHRPDRAAAILARVAADRRSPTAELRARALYAQALQLRDAGERARALRTLRQALGVLDANRLAVDAATVLCPASVVVAVSGLGLSLAIEAGRPGAILTWAERVRARALRAPRVAAPHDPGLAAGVARLRFLRHGLSDAAFVGEPPGLRPALARAEADLRHASTVDPSAAEPVESTATRSRLVEHLREAVLVEYVERRGRLWAVTVTRSRSRLWELGSVEDVRAELGRFRSGLRQLASGLAGPGPDRALLPALERLDELLLTPLAGTLRDRPVVVVPTSVLHPVAWSLLPSRAGIPLVLAPSAGRWLAATRRTRRPPERTLVIAGPGSARGATEVRALSQAFGDRTWAVYERATADLAVGHFGRSDLVHVTASGTFRADNPYFSTIDLADGPLAVHRLVAGGRVPDTIVFSTCRTGFVAQAPGDDLIALATVLIDLGARTVIGSPLMVPDANVTTMMTGFHARLAAMGPAAALAAAQEETCARLPAGEQGAWSRAAVASFSCLGAG